jgi:transposase-like protein
MDKDQLKQALLRLSSEECNQLFKEVNQSTNNKPSVLDVRRSKLNQKQGQCPHCGGFKYTKFGIDKGSQRYRCKSCKKTFTEYTGTWLHKIQRKDVIEGYLQLLNEQKSLDKIKLALGINKKTAFDWRHKILSGAEHNGQTPFQGLTESDETFFLISEKGTQNLNRTPRKRGGKASQKGISNEQVAVIVTADRVSEIDLRVARLGRIRKSDIDQAIGNRVTAQTILCSDSHVSYKSFAKAKQIEHHAIRANLKQFVKQKRYHVQHVNSIDSRLKKWIRDRFNGVSTKYLQKYLNWFRLNEMYKDSPNFYKLFTDSTLVDLSAWKNFKEINSKFQKIIQNSTLN